MPPGHSEVRDFATQRDLVLRDHANQQNSVFPDARTYRKLAFPDTLPNQQELVLQDLDDEQGHCDQVNDSTERSGALKEEERNSEKKQSHNSSSLSSGELSSGPPRKKR